MTGFGEAHHQDGDRVVRVEIRTINNRYFKLSSRISDGYGSLETQLEQVVRGQVKRGTVQLSLRVERIGSVDHYQLNEAVLAGYCQQLSSFQQRRHLSEVVALGNLLTLPGVVIERVTGNEAVEDWPRIEAVLLEALRRLTEMRATEGAAMATDLSANLDQIAAELAAIKARAPQLIENYRERLIDRLGKLLAEHKVEVQPSDVIREVGLFAERSDISEEIVRLASHLDQFRECMNPSPGSKKSAAGKNDGAGRKLDFVTQEMFRETNTIGSKSTDAEISRRVIEIKTAIERIREMVQNVE
ncbi:MAG: YicC family protein [Planctomycetia bacterium]|nr:YicC family protein [Planctomycetia bacterium]